MLPTVIGPYHIIRLLGEGGMGLVYEARHETIERRVALKVLLPAYAHDQEALSRFFNEARAVNRIEHPSLVQISDFGHAEDGTAYLVMEFLHGETLTARLGRMQAAGQRMALGEALQIAAQIADALAAAHAKDIVHRDLKPGNVMLVPDPVSPSGERAKILDFGIAKLIQHKGKGTTARAIMGTPEYMSPEQCRGAGEVDHKSDVYALGVMLYELLAGRLPFLGEGHGDFIGQHMYKEPPPLRQVAPRVPPEVALLVHRLLAKDRTPRPQMREVGAELAKLLAGLAAHGDAPVARPRAERTDPETPALFGEALSPTVGAVARRKRRTRVAAAALLIAVFASATLYGIGKYVFARQRPAIPAAQGFPVAAAPLPTPPENLPAAPIARPPAPLPVPVPAPLQASGPAAPAPIPPAKKSPAFPLSPNPTARAAVPPKPPLTPKPAPPKLRPASSGKSKVEYED